MFWGSFPLRWVTFRLSRFSSFPGLGHFYLLSTFHFCPLFTFVHFSALFTFVLGLSFFGKFSQVSCLSGSGVPAFSTFCDYFVEYVLEWAFAIVGWVGIKLVVMVLAHPDIGVLPEEFPHGALWQSIFWAVLILLVIIGWFTSVIKNKKKNK